MNPNRLRLLLKQALATSLPITGLMMPMFGESGQPPSVQLNGGCCDYKTHNGGIKIALDSSAQNKTFTYQECIQLCQQALGNDPSLQPGSDPGGSLNLNITHCEKEEGKQPSIYCQYTASRICGPAGRRPQGLQPLPQKKPHNPRELHDGSAFTNVGELFAEMTHLETAAVEAFRYLLLELQALNAPQHLLEATAQAIEEEIEHAALSTALTQRFQGQLYPIEIQPFQQRPLFEIALDNLQEGCVRELYGATLGIWQANHAQDHAVRAAMSRIADEETSHAALSMQIHQWLSPQLSPTQQTQCKHAFTQAIDTLKTELQNDPPLEIQQIAGYPSSSQALKLVDSLETMIWNSL